MTNSCSIFKREITQEEENVIERAVKGSKTLAILGLSPKPDRVSYHVAEKLQKMGYKIIPVYPREEEILGEKVYRNFKEIPVNVDTVILFISADKMVEFVKDAVEISPKCIWGQESVIDAEAYKAVEGTEIDLVMDVCFYKKAVAYGISK
ncbi:MAG: CoA-binding protein [Fusobacteria bacterium]|nr:CoA-binding protein [Fusobacteriota bacterium]